MHLFDDFIAKNQQLPFKWGEHDCCMFVANWILIRTGQDLASDFRNQYTTQKGAFKSLIKAGLNDVETLFKVRLKTPIPVSFAKRGDVALVTYNNELVGGIIGLNCVYCVGEYGIKNLPLSSVSSAFSLAVLL